MATISYFLGELPASLVCTKGGAHEEQALNLVCLNQKCRNNPLCCCVCFTNNHKVK
jgi:hypothetical protein